MRVRTRWALHIRTYEFLKESAVDVLDRIQSEPVSPRRLYVRFSSQERGPRLSLSLGRRTCSTQGPQEKKSLATSG